MTDQHPEYDAPGTGPFYAYDTPTIERAIEHGCLDEDVETGDSIVCAECSTRPASDPAVERVRVDGRTPGEDGPLDRTARVRRAERSDS